MQDQDAAHGAPGCPPECAGQTVDAASGEAARLRARRELLGLGTEGDVWGFALSGGGIRSATFSLGVIQALTRIPAPGAAPATAPGPIAGAAPPDTEIVPLLGRFDYLSTVSGGGYIGGFLCGLFVPGRIARDDLDARQVARNAYRVLRAEPPGRLREEDDLSDLTTGKGPMAWLRENGRYLTPTGSGDYLYAAALAVRNLLALYYVLGTLMLCALCFLAVLRTSAIALSQDYANLEAGWLAHTGPGLWLMNPFWAATAAVLAFVLVPIGTAYWLSVRLRTEPPDERPHIYSAASVTDLVVALVAAIVVVMVPRHDVLHRLAPYVCYVAIVAFVVHASSALRCETAFGQRTMTTRWLASGLKLVLGLAAVALVETVTQFMYANWSRFDWRHFASGSLVPLVIWLVRRLSASFDEKEKPAWIMAVPGNVLAGAVGAALLLVATASVDLLVYAVAWRGEPPSMHGLADRAQVSDKLMILAYLAGFSLVLAWATGRFPGFINLSTLQTFYGMRLCRAYLGASNRFRFEAGDLRRNRSVADPIRNDDITMPAYYGSCTGAPLHLVNVTVNQTVDSAEQLVQRDRKGKPLCVTPVGFSIDGTSYRFADGSGRAAPTGRPSRLKQFLATVGYTGVNEDIGHGLSLSRWLGTSGAAFTTGLGRSTRLGVSLALGLCNVRLGTWWPSGVARDQARALERGFRALFETQTYLIYELFGRFYGLRRPWQYLSDGGHFENTAVYELLRPERRAGLIVVCDNGCDLKYRFEDFGNLIRLARIDYKVEISVDAAIARDPVLGTVFGVPDDFSRDRAPSGAPLGDKCAVLFDVRHPDRANGPGEILSRIILLKPVVIDSAPLDVREYSKTHPAFPQESTADQFFNEAQWESYRRLGLAVATRVFALVATGSDGKPFNPLWAYLGVAKQVAADAAPACPGLSPTPERAASHSAP